MVNALSGDSDLVGIDVLPMTPPEGWTLDTLPPGLPPHTELIRGVLVENWQTTWHLFAVRTMQEALAGSGTARTSRRFTLRWASRRSG
jgi:hypothetical protein